MVVKANTIKKENSSPDARKAAKCCLFVFLLIFSKLFDLKQTQDEFFKNRALKRFTTISTFEEN